MIEQLYGMLVYIALVLPIVWLEDKIHRKRAFLALSKSKAYYHSQKKGTEFTQKLRDQIYLRDGGRCRACGALTVKHKSQQKRTLSRLVVLPLYHVNHLLPDAFGGEACLENGAVFCEKCNFFFKDKITAHSLEYLQYRKNSGKPHLLYLTDKELESKYFPLVYTAKQLKYQIAMRKRLEKDTFFQKKY